MRGLRGRPRRMVQPVIINIKLCLMPGQDDDLIAFFERLPARQRARRVQAMLRGGHIQDAIENDLADQDILEAFQNRIF